MRHCTPPSCTAEEPPPRPQLKLVLAQTLTCARRSPGCCGQHGLVHSRGEGLQDLGDLLRLIDRNVWEHHDVLCNRWRRVACRHLDLGITSSTSTRKAGQSATAAKPVCQCKPQGRTDTVMNDTQLTNDAGAHAPQKSQQTQPDNTQHPAGLSPTMRVHTRCTSCAATSTSTPGASTPRSTEPRRRKACSSCCTVRRHLTGVGVWVQMR